MLCASCTREITLEGIKFCPFCGASLQAKPEERRTAIVVFGDLCDFTSLSEQKDPDELRALLNSLMTRFQSIVDEKRGVVDKIIGDAILFLFNTEKSFGNDHILAIETVEAMQQHLTEINRSLHLTLNLHFGISFGRVSVGAVGTSRTVMGDTVNVAQRLLTLAGPGEVIVSEAFAQLFGPSHRFNVRPPIKVKGKTKLVRPCQYLGKAAFEQSQIPLVGRTTELDEIQRKVRELIDHKKGGDLLVLGEAGLGKSLLLSTVRREFADQVLSAELRFQEVGGKFHAAYENFFRSLFALHRDRLTELPLPIAILEGTEYWRKATFEQISDLLIRTLQLLSIHTPFLLLIEDLHHADTSSRELIRRLVDTLKGAMILILAASRKNYDFFASFVSLNPLSDEESEQLFSTVAPGASQRTLDIPKLLKQCAGNPFFVQELARGVNLNIPENQLFSGNVELLLAATLDTQPSEDRELVKMASVFGSQIKLSYLAKFSELHEESLFPRLERIGLFGFSAARNLLWFRHDLLRKSAYDRINLGIREEWHERVAEILIDDEAFPEEIAHHFLRTTRKREALRLALQAAKRLSRLPRQDETFGFLADTERLAREFEDSNALKDTLALKFEIESRGLSLENGIKELGRLEPELGKDIHWAKAQFLFRQGEYNLALKEADQTLTIGRPDHRVDAGILKARGLLRLGQNKAVVKEGIATLRNPSIDSARRGEVFLILGNVSYLDRELPQAEDFYKKALDAYRRADDLTGVAKALGNLGNISFARGRYDEARVLYEQYGETAIRFGDMVQHGQALMLQGKTKVDLLRFDEAQRDYRAAMTLAEKYGNDDLLKQVEEMLAFLFRQIGFFDQSKAIFSRILAFFRDRDLKYFFAQAVRGLSLVSMDMREFDRALTLLDENWTVVQSFPNQAQLGRLLRAEVLTALNRMDEARSEIERFERAFPARSISEAVHLEYLVAKSIVENQREANTFDLLRSALKGKAAPSNLLHRLPLLVETLEYGPDPDLMKEATGIVERIRAGLTDEERKFFETTPIVRRLQEITKRN